MTNTLFRLYARVIWRLILAEITVLLLHTPTFAQPEQTMGSGATVLSAKSHQTGHQLILFLRQSIALTTAPDGRLPLADLAELINKAVANHPEVRLSEAQQINANQAAQETFAGFLPQVSGNFDAGSRKYDAVKYPWSQLPAHQQKSVAIGVNIRQLLFDFGATAKRFDAQRTRETGLSARVEARHSELTLRALIAWHEVFRAQQMLKLNEMNVLARQQIQGFIEERAQLGGSSNSDVLRVQARVSDAKVAALAAKNHLKTAEASYWEIFQSAPAPVLALPVDVDIDMQPYQDLSHHLQKNAVLREARANSEAAALDAQAAASNMLPRLSLELNATRRDLAGNGQPGNDIATTLVVNYTLFSGGAEMARKNQAIQRSLETNLDADNQQRQLEKTFAQILTEVENSQANIMARREAAQVATLALEAVREQFAFRRGTLLDLLRAQEELYIAGKDLIDGLVDHALARYKLRHLSMDLLPLFNPADHTASHEEQNP